MEFIVLMDLLHPLCCSQTDCNDCPLGPHKNGLGEFCGRYLHTYPAEAEAIIIEWNEEYRASHYKTLAQKFKETFPDSPVIDYPNICPSVFGKTFTGPDWKAEDHCGNGCRSCWESRVPDDA